MAATTERSQRIEQLLRFLSHDEGNDILREEIFTLALQEGDMPLAERQLEEVRARGSLSPQWRLQESNLHIARRQYDLADALLTQLENETGPHPAIAQNHGFIAMQQNQPERCMEHLQRWCEVAATTTLDPGMQSLWLRCLHHLGRLEEALEWAQMRVQAQHLAQEAAAVASLIALDADQLPLAQAWSTQSLSSGHVSLENLLTGSALALRAQDSGHAAVLAQQALQYAPADGRAWSSLGFAQMLALDLASARQSLEQGVTYMPSHIGTWHGLAWVCLLQKDYVAAHRAFSQALEVDRNFGETHGGLAVVAFMEGHQEQARESLRRAQGLNAQGVTAQYAQALLAGTVNDERSIREFSQRLLEQITR